MDAPFTIAMIEETITDESAAVGDVATSEMSEDSGASFREALQALENGCWDHVDWRPSEVIAYPADWHQDMHTGDYDAETLVIRSRRADWLERLATAYENRRNRA